MAGYRPSRGDKQFKDADHSKRFETARALRKISDDYLSSLIGAAVHGEEDRSSGYLAQLQFEVSRRAARRSQIALVLQAMSVLVAVSALGISIAFN